MTPKTDKQGIASANMKQDKMDIARSAIRTSTTEKEVMNKLKSGFASIKPDSTIRGGFGGYFGGIKDKRDYSATGQQKERADKLDFDAASKRFEATLNKKGDPIKKKKK